MHIQDFGRWRDGRGILELMTTEYSIV
jgi:hypothetical protein